MIMVCIGLVFVSSMRSWSSCVNRLASRSLVWYPDPSVQAHARTRITACACGKEGSGEMDGLRTGKSWNVKTVLECN